jgi:hypothetical protein
MKLKMFIGISLAVILLGSIGLFLVFRGNDTLKEEGSNLPVSGKSLARYETMIAAVQCSSFDLEVIKQEKYDKETNLQADTRLWYVRENAERRIVDTTIAANNFPTFALPEAFVWFYPLHNNDPLGANFPGDVFFWNITVPGTPAAPTSDDSFLSAFSPEEYSAIANCLSKHTTDFLPFLTRAVTESSTGKRIDVPVVIGSVTYIPWISEEEGGFSLRHPYEYTCPDNSTVSVAGDNTVRISGRPIGYVDERGYFIEGSITVTREFKEHLIPWIGAETPEVRI